MQAHPSDCLGEVAPIGANDVLSFYELAYTIVETSDGASGKTLFKYGVVCRSSGELYLTGVASSYDQAKAALDSFRRLYPTAAGAVEHLKRCRVERLMARQQQEQLACLQQQQLACWHGILILEQQLRSPARRIPAPLQPPPPPGKHQEERCRPHSPDPDGPSF